MKFTCDQCDATYPVRMSLTNHKRLKHCDVKHFKCAHCLYSTTKKDICNNEFSDKPTLDIHKRRKHAETLQTKRNSRNTNKKIPDNTA